MQLRKITLFATIIVAVATLFPSLYGLANDKPSKFLVRFIETSTVVHSAWSGNQDTYLVELRKKSSDLPFVAKLVDEYPGYGNALPLHLLVADTTSVIRVRRDVKCDVRYGDMPRRTAPNISTFPISSNLQADPDFTVKCFRLVRKITD
jgi:hypothetical protein